MPGEIDYNQWTFSHCGIPETGQFRWKAQPHERWPGSRRIEGKIGHRGLSLARGQARLSVLLPLWLPESTGQPRQKEEHSPEEKFFDLELRENRTSWKTHDRGSARKLIEPRDFPLEGTRPREGPTKVQPQSNPPSPGPF